MAPSAARRGRRLRRERGFARPHGVDGSLGCAPRGRLRRERGFARPHGPGGAATRSGQKDAPGAREPGTQRVVHRAVGPPVCDRPGCEQADAVAEVDTHPTVVGTERTRADPDDLARGAQLVEHRGPVTLDPGGEDVAFEHRRGDRDTLELLERLDERVEPAPAPPDALPRGQEAGERRRVDRLDLVPHRGERTAPEHAQDVRVAPLAFHAARAELAVEHAFLGCESRRARRGRVRR